MSLQLNPYLNFKGNAEEAFNFYKSVFGGEFSTVMRFKDTAEAGRVSPGEGEKMMHIALPIGKGNVLMATDALESMGHGFTAGNNFYISVSAESEQEGLDLFNKLSAGGKVDVPYSKMFWGAFFGQFSDQFGIRWMVNYDENQNNKK